MARRCAVRTQALARGYATALVFEGREWAWAELDAWVGRVVTTLARWDVRRGERVAVLSPNAPGLVPLYFALARLGASLVPLNARLTAGELAPLIERADARLRLAAPTLLDRLPGARDLEAFTLAGEGEDPPEDAAEAEVEPSLPAAHLFTSGTTGTPSLITLTHANFDASAEASARNLPNLPTHAWWGSLPLFHVGGLAMLTRCAASGATLWLEPGFDLARARQVLSSGQVSHASLVPTMLARLLAEEPSQPSRRLEAILIGGGPVDSAVMTRARSAGLPVLQTWGLTEACSQVATERPAEADGATAGPPLPGLEVRVVDEGGHDLGPGARGELLVRGPTVHAAAGEWLRTGDLGWLDERGRVTVWSRRTDLIVTGGENVSPFEVEAVLAQHPGVREVAVVAASDATWGQVPVAFVVTAPELSMEALSAFATDRLAGFKRPRVFHRLDTLPRTATGKLQRARLRDLAEAHTSVTVPPSATSSAAAPSHGKPEP